MARVLVKAPSGMVNISVLKPGEFAVVRDKVFGGKYDGLVVMGTFGDQAVSITDGTTWSWCNGIEKVTLQVERLPKGTEIVITV